MQVVLTIRVLYLLSSYKNETLMNYKNFDMHAQRGGVLIFTLQEITP